MGLREFSDARYLTRRRLLKSVGAAALTAGVSEMIGAAPAVSLASPKGQTLTLWHWETPPSRVAAFQKLFDRFTSETQISVRQVPINFPDYHTKILTAAPAGQLPDIAFANPPEMMLLISNNLAVPVDDIFARVDSQAHFFSTYRDYSLRGKQWGVPLFGVCWPLTYRKDLHLSAGFNGAPQTWDDTLRRAQRMNKRDMPGFFLPASTNGNYGNQVVWGFLRTNGARIVAGPPGKEKVIFNSKESRETYKFLKELYQYTGPGSENANWASTELLIRSGRVQTLVYNGAPIGQLVKTNRGLAHKYSWGLVPRPSRSARPANTGYARAAMITRDAVKRGALDAAKEWLVWINRPENHAELLLANPGLFMPVDQATATAKVWTGDPFNKEFKDLIQVSSEAMKYISVEGFEDGARSLKAAAIEGSFLTAAVLQKIVLERESVETAVAWGHSQFEKILKS